MSQAALSGKRSFWATRALLGILEVSSSVDCVRFSVADMSRVVSSQILSSGYRISTRVGNFQGVLGGYFHFQYICDV